MSKLVTCTVSNSKDSPEYLFVTKKDLYGGIEINPKPVVETKKDKEMSKESCFWLGYFLGVVWTVIVLVGAYYFVK